MQWIPSWGAWPDLSDYIHYLLLVPWLEQSIECDVLEKGLQVKHLETKIQRFEFSDIESSFEFECHCQRILLPFGRRHWDGGISRRWSWLSSRRCKGDGVQFDGRGLECEEARITIETTNDFRSGWECLQSVLAWQPPMGRTRGTAGATSIDRWFGIHVVGLSIPWEGVGSTTKQYTNRWDKRDTSQQELCWCWCSNRNPWTSNEERLEALTFCYLFWAWSE